MKLMVRLYVFIERFLSYYVPYEFIAISRFTSFTTKTKTNWGVMEVAHWMVQRKREWKKKNNKTTTNPNTMNKHKTELFNWNIARMCKWKPIYSYHSLQFSRATLPYSRAKIFHLLLFCSGPYFICIILFNNLIIYRLYANVSITEFEFISPISPSKCGMKKTPMARAGSYYKNMSLICIARDFSRFHFFCVPCFY